jgi:uncharacterized membrane protein HdeD (DUF308 family)
LYNQLALIITIISSEYYRDSNKIAVTVFLWRTPHKSARRTGMIKRTLWFFVRCHIQGSETQSLVTTTCAIILKSKRGILIAGIKENRDKMKNSLYNRKHLREYLFYGFLSSIAYIVPVWVFFFYLDYNKVFIIFLGSILFMFVIMLYTIKLSKRRPEYKSAWMMIIASHSTVLAGIAFSVLFTTILCFIYIPGFLSGNSISVLTDSPKGLNNHNWSLLTLLYLCATVENFGAGGFMAVLGPYVFKKNQTRDKTAILEKNIKPSQA